MGYFIEKTVELKQLTKDIWPEFFTFDTEFKAGIFITETDLTYVISDRQSITIPCGYITDGYSKPRITEFLVGGRFEDDNRPSTLHDYLCQNKGYVINDIHIPLTFKQVNDLFYDAMISVGINKFKALIMRFAVNFNPDRW